MSGSGGGSAAEVGSGSGSGSGSSSEAAPSPLSIAVQEVGGELLPIPVHFCSPNAGLGGLSPAPPPCRSQARSVSQHQAVTAHSLLVTSRTYTHCSCCVPGHVTLALQSLGKEDTEDVPADDTSYFLNMCAASNAKTLSETVGQGLLDDKDLGAKMDAAIKLVQHKKVVVLYKPGGEAPAAQLRVKKSYIPTCVRMVAAILVTEVS